ncbi:hypothetical protein OG455_28825 [Kitasatospora sp. NBC_01287]|uniref:hypothetical protein n=1 Tax=Kitasatospora sp. NBC_01287 TaxID=2903573 RepID=UPI0022553E51|nr:hypothetical protein [Kitasatospora sp. NBC_01287]MCX4749468.1 hypothetical protein [Kitasatospora sp. NBC_01287]
MTRRQSASRSWEGGGTVGRPLNDTALVVDHNARGWATTGAAVVRADPAGPPARRPAGRVAG